MRLIDADAIHYCNYDLDNYHSFRAVDEDEIAEMPTIDAVPVVRCRDCKHYEKDALWCNINSCQFEATHHNWYEEDFCSHGERREENAVD